MNEPLRYTPDGLLDMDQFNDDERSAAHVRNAIRSAARHHDEISDEAWERSLERIRISAARSEGHRERNWYAAEIGVIDMAQFSDADDVNQDTWRPIRAAMQSAARETQISDVAWASALRTTTRPLATNSETNDGDPPATVTLLLSRDEGKRRRSAWAVGVAIPAAAVALIFAATQGSSPSPLAFDTLEAPTASLPATSPASTAPTPVLADTPASTPSTPAPRSNPKPDVGTAEVSGSEPAPGAPLPMVSAPAATYRSTLPPPPKSADSDSIAPTSTTTELVGSVVTPNVVNLTARQAAEVLADLGLVAEFQTADHLPTSPNGPEIVTSQQPQPGKPTPAGSTITLALAH